MGGIRFKAPNSAVVSWAGDIYLRTGTTSTADGSLNQGSITFDAQDAGVNIKAAVINTYVSEGFGINVGPSGTNATVSSAHYFGDQYVQLDGNTVVSSTANILGTVSVRGGCNITGSFGSVSNAQVGLLIGGQFASSLDQLDIAISTLQKNEGKEYTALFTNDLYAAGSMGDDTVITQAMFSFRDDLSGDQYIVHDDFVFGESRWQQMTRLSGDNQGAVWDEPTVQYQGRDLLPWPGKSKWQDESAMLQLTELTLFDSKNGLAKDRAGGIYETPALASPKQAVLNQNFKTIF